MITVKSYLALAWAVSNVTFENQIKNTCMKANII